MSIIVLHPPLAPRDGKILRVLEIDRISTKNQNVKANDDQLARNRRWVQDRFDGSVDWTRITGQGSGECLGRAEVVEAEEKIATGEFDVAIMEDLGRHLRRIQAVVLCEL